MQDEETAFYKISTFITKLVSGGDSKKKLCDGVVYAFTWARVSGEVMIRG